MKTRHEKRLKKHFEQIMKFSNQNIHIASTLIALIVVSTLLVYSYILINKGDEYINFYILDQNRRAEKYPEVVILGKNNTFTVFVVVENYMKRTLTGEVLLKITDKPVYTFPTPVEPAQSFYLKIDIGKSMEIPFEVTLNMTGKFNLIFELWILNGEKYELDKFLVLNVDVKED